MAIGATSPWGPSVLLYLLSSTFVLVAVLRYLIGRITESVRVETDALRVEADVFEKNAAVEASLIKSRFVALVSHELRTPLGAIVGTAELLETTALTDRQRQFAAALRTSTRTLHRIVDDLLDFSRIEAGRMELVNEPYDLAQTIDDLVVLFREQARQRT